MASLTDSFLTGERYEREPDLGLLVQRAVTLLQREQPSGGYVGGFSGGKDSCVIKRLAELAEVDIEWHYHQTTIDPPELIWFLREHHPDVIWDRPKYGSLWRRCTTKAGGSFPSRRIRWCCREYKERAFPRSKTVVLGIRIAESARRARVWTACMMEPHGRYGRTVLPIRLWSDANVWEFIRRWNVPVCGLYAEGFTRLGCVGCPLQSPEGRRRDFRRWPRFERGWRKALTTIWTNSDTTGSLALQTIACLFPDGDAFFQWWVDGCPNISNWLQSRTQTTLPWERRSQPDSEQPSLFDGGEDARD